MTTEHTKSTWTGNLLRVLGAGFGLAVTVGGMVGMGILRTPGEVAGHLPNASLFLGIWLAGGIYALLGAITVAELGAMVPRSGGFYVFARRAFGPYAGFIVGWTDWLATSGTTAVIAIAAGEYAEELLPNLAGGKVTVAAAAVFGLAALQWHGVRWGSRTQALTSLVKAVAFLGVVLACFARGNRNPLEPAVGQAGSAGFGLLTALVLSLQAVIYTYDGWYNALYFAGEIRDPGRNLPRSMIGGVLAVAVLYLLMNLAVLAVLPLSAIAGKTMALGEAAEVLFGAQGGRILRAVAAISLLSTINADNLLAPRILHAMSTDGLLARRVGYVNAGGTPTVALFLSAAAPVVFLLTGTFDQVLAVVAFFFVINYLLAFLAVIVLRWREPHLPRPYRTWGYPWTPTLAIVGSLLFLAGAVASDPWNSFIAVALLAVSYPAYLLLKRSESPGNAVIV